MSRKNGQATIIQGTVVYTQLLRENSEGWLYRCTTKEGRSFLLTVPRGNA